MVHALSLTLLLAVAATAAYGCAVPPEGCKISVCDSYAGLRMMDQGLNYSAAATWSSQDVMMKIGVYKGVANKVANGGVRPVRNTYGRWLTNYKGRVPAYPALNYEKFKPEPAFETAYPDKMGLSACCHKCRTDEGCVMFKFAPSATGKGASLDTAGTCSRLTGGTYKGDGPYNPATQVELGTPPSGTSSDQASGWSKNFPLSFVGGFCNPFKQVVDDPHFTGAHGTPFDFNGELEKAFCLITDQAFHVNAVLKGYKSDNAFRASAAAEGKATRSWIRELGFLWRGGHSLRLVARDGTQQERGQGFLARAELDGEAIAVPTEEGTPLVRGELTLAFLGAGKVGPYDVERFNVRVGELLDVSFSMRVAHRLLQAPDSAEVHFNLMFNSIRATEKVHGVLGQTYRNTPEQLAKALKYSELTRLLGQPVQADGESGRGFLEGEVADYEASEVIRADCKVSSFAV